MKTLVIYIVALAVSVASHLRAGVLIGPVTNSSNGHLYYLLTQNDWGNSELEAVRLGGHLVTINDQAEEDWVYSTFRSVGGVPRSLWIGFTDDGHEGVWTWASGEPVTYTHWAPGEPNNFGGVENAAHIWHLTDPLGRGGLWNDGPSTNVAVTGGVSIHGVVEVVPRSGTPLQSGVTIWTAVEITWPVVPDRYYQVEWTTDVTSNATWSYLGLPVRGVGQTNVMFDTTRQSPRRFYRVLELQ